MSNSLTIRRMTLEDVPHVHQVEIDSFAIPWSQKSLEDEVTKNPCARYLVGLVEGKIVAYAGVWIVLDEGHITNIAVLKAYRGRGIGEELTKSLLQYGANLGVAYVTLEVRASNIPAQSLYQKLGFVKAGVRKKYYEDNQEDALLMVKDKMPPAEENFREAETIEE